MANNKSKRVKKKKINKKDIVKILIPLVGIIILLYVLYKIFSLIIVPTDVVVIENGTILNEEEAVRLYY